MGSKLAGFMTDKRICPSIDEDNTETSVDATRVRYRAGHVHDEKRALGPYSANDGAKHRDADLMTATVYERTMS